jgi:hypothetical protein
VGGMSLYIGSDTPSEHSGRTFGVAFSGRF